MKPLTAEEIAELRQLEAEATPAPWRWDDDVLRGPPGVQHRLADPDDLDPPDGTAIVQTDSGYYGPHGAEKPLLPAMRNALPRLLDGVERSRALLKRIEWSGRAVDGSALCPACGGEDPTNFQPFHPGHEAGCELAALIGGS